MLLILRVRASLKLAIPGVSRVRADTIRGIGLKAPSPFFDSPAVLREIASAESIDSEPGPFRVYGVHSFT